MNGRRWNHLGRERIYCALAFLPTPVCQKASAIEILTFYNFFNKSQNMSKISISYLICSHISRKVVLQTRIFFSGQPLFSNLKKGGFIKEWILTRRRNFVYIHLSSTVVSVSTVQPSLNQEFLSTLRKTLKCLCTLSMKKMHILYEK